MEVAIGQDVDGHGLYDQAIDGQGIKEQGMHMEKTDDQCIAGQDIDMEIAISQCIDSQVIQIYDRGMETGAIRCKDNQCISGQGIKMEKTDSQDEDRDTTVKCTQKRVKIAMFLAYCGGGFQGMQKNPGAITIEGELEKALLRSGAMPHNYGDNPRRVDWTRAARTDKGVSAVCQVVSGLFFVDPPGFVERVNSYLPEKIRLLGYKNVTSSFSAKRFCDRRRYEYVIPSFALDPTTHRDRESVIASEGKEGSFMKCVECCERGRKIQRESVKGWDSKQAMNEKQVNRSSSSNCVDNSLSSGMTSVFSQESVSFSSVENMEELHCSVEAGKVSSFNFRECDRKRLNRILNRFVGVHNFHNFTSRIRPDDPRAMRCVISFEVGTVFNVRDMELVSCVVVGQSFMLHQIRKMIGLAIAVFRGSAPESIIDMALRRYALC